jgi:ribonuclease P protein component
VLERLKRRQEFLRVAEARRKWVAPGLILQAARSAAANEAAPGAGPAKVRVGFTASRKVGGAVVRNRARRRLRDAAARVLALHAEPGHDYVVIARSGTVARPYDKLLDDLAAGLRRLGLYRNGEPSKPENA